MCASDKGRIAQESETVKSPSPALAGLFVDSHCHPTDDSAAYTSPNLDELSNRIENANVDLLLCMSTNASDQSLVAELASRHPHKVIPCFGWHPWFAHQISLSDPPSSKKTHYYELFNIHSIVNDDGKISAKQELDAIWEQLPDPVSLESVCQGIREQFERFPNALLGEVGVDRAFRIPRRAWSYDPQRTENEISEPKLTKLKTPQAHQLSILRAQIDVALQYQRNISLHSVQAAGLTVDLLESLRNTDTTAFGAIRVSLHSCTLDNNVVRSITKKHPNVYVGFSSTINRKQILAKECLTSVDCSRALMESDHHTVKDIPMYLLQAAEYFAQLYDLDLDAAARQLRSNWDSFYSAKRPGESDSDNSDADGTTIYQC
ncbi:related to Cut9 interacting protein scn1 [Melanopsichium pennsylvanicum]|uniref:Related to Cut9 interacting protein scn1 n=2 Tax=Melanopsichium pennsylvanicum TaxID=63383 RepID=A0AAJ5C2Z1_9BASI|nr:related to Cut9 interacting protein scn1 [Melanopsichium pennsylvanicum 4]SNX82037.1 related to Cut9 interacting protein scn1 [Melanopsichium pennsylvanicum]